jgi:hypothetical protein
MKSHTDKHCRELQEAVEELIEGKMQEGNRAPAAVQGEPQKT